MKLVCLLTALLTIVLPLCGAEHRTVRDSSGRISGTATTNGSTTTYRDSSGRITGTKR